MNVQLASAALPRTEPCSGSAWKENGCVLGCVTCGELREGSDLPGPAWSGHSSLFHPHPVLSLYSKYKLNKYF